MMRKILQKKDIGDGTAWSLSDGCTMIAVYCYAVGTETGCHCRHDTRTEITLVDADGDEIGCEGYTSPQDAADEYDWDALETEIELYAARIGWLEG